MKQRNERLFLIDIGLALRMHWSIKRSQQGIVITAPQSCRDIPSSIRKETASIIVWIYKMFEINSVVAVCRMNVEAENSVKKTNRAGIDLRDVFIFSGDSRGDDGAMGYYHSGDGVKCRGKAVAFCGSLWGLRCWSALMAMAGLSQVLTPSTTARRGVGRRRGRGWRFKRHWRGPMENGVLSDGPWRGAGR